MVIFGRKKEMVIKRELLVMFFFLELSTELYLLYCVLGRQLYFTTKKVFERKEQDFPHSIPQEGKSSECLCVRLGAPFLKPWENGIQSECHDSRPQDAHNLVGMRDT